MERIQRLTEKVFRRLDGLIPERRLNNCNKNKYVYNCSIKKIEGIITIFRCFIPLTPKKLRIAYYRKREYVVKNWSGTKKREKNRSNLRKSSVSIRSINQRNVF